MKNAVASLIATIILAVTAAAQEPRFEERVDVQRLILDGYITDSKGNPIPGVQPEDVEVRIGGRSVKVESVDWIPVEQTVSFEDGSEPLVMREGRLIVLYFQTDFARNAARVKGHMSLIPQAKRFLDELNPSDLVAVVQFDSHLKIRSDFISDRDTLETLIERSLSIDLADPLPPDGEVSLLEHIDLDEAKRAATPEQSLVLLGRALEPIPGAKALIMFGWGLGVYGGGGVSMGAHYDRARSLLERARASVFALDFTEADYHTLEVGMQKVAGDTGGFYEKTFRFGSIAFERLANTLKGRYEIVVDSTGIRPGRRDVSVRVKSRGVYHVQFPGTIVVE